jgi:hypothetical protein
MFDAAIKHRDALVHLLTLRGDGDLLAGWQSTCFFTRKSSQWWIGLLPNYEATC